MRAGPAAAFTLLLALPAARAIAAEYISPPIIPIPNAWQGRSQAVIRVLDKLDAHIETLTLKAGDSGSYKSLTVTVRSCMDRPDGLPADSGAFVDIQDRHGDVQPFSGWTFSGEPAIGVFESPVYAVQLVTCQGDLVAPMAPPLPQAVPAPPDLLPPPPPVAAASDVAGAQDQGAGGTDTGASDSDKASSNPSSGGPASGDPASGSPASGSSVDDGSESPPPADTPGQGGATSPDTAPADAPADAPAAAPPPEPDRGTQAPANGDGAAPDPVYPAGPPSGSAAPPAAAAAPPPPQ